MGGERANQKDVALSDLQENVRVELYLYQKATSREKGESGGCGKSLADINFRKKTQRTQKSLRRKTHALRAFQGQASTRLSDHARNRLDDSYVVSELLSRRSKEKGDRGRSIKSQGKRESARERESYKQERTISLPSLKAQERAQTLLPWKEGRGKCRLSGQLASGGGNQWGDCIRLC